VRVELLIERLRHGQLSLFDAEFPRCWAVATDVLHSVELERQLHVMRAGRIGLSGDIDAALVEAEKGLRLMASDSPRWLQPSRLCSRPPCGAVPKPGRSRRDAGKRASNPEHVSIPHLAAPAAALAYAERGDLEQARRVTRQWFAPPRIWSRRQALAYWAQVSVLTGEPDPQWCYEQLLPRAGELALVSGRRSVAARLTPSWPGWPFGRAGARRRWNGLRPAWPWSSRPGPDTGRSAPPSSSIRWAPEPRRARPLARGRDCRWRLRCRARPHPVRAEPQPC
jgi:hypothetical protein